MATVTTRSLFPLLWESSKDILKVVKLSLFLSVSFPPTFFTSLQVFAESRISHRLYMKKMPVKIEKIIEPNVYLWVVGLLWSPVSLCEMGANWMFIVKQRQLSGFQPYNTGFFKPECICVTFSPWSIKTVRSKCEWTSCCYAFIMLWLWIVNHHHHISLIAVWAFTKSVSPDKIRGTR